VVKKLVLEFSSQDFALSFKTNRKSLNQMVLLETPFIFMVSHFSKNDEICVLGSAREPSELLLLKRVVCPALNLKLFASIGGLMMLEETKFGSSIAKSLNDVVAFPLYFDFMHVIDEP